MREIMNAKSEVRLTARQQRAAILLASGYSISSVVQELEMHRSTLADWQRLPEFEALLNQLLEEGRAAAHAKIGTLSEKAVNVLEKLLDRANERIRLATASDILRHLSGVQIGPARVGAIKSQRRLEQLGDFGETFVNLENEDAS
jgi:HEAT repeat protein